MPYIRLATTSAALSYETGSEGHAPRLAFGARQGDEDEVTIGKKGLFLADLSGNLLVTVEEEPLPNAGTLAYFEPLHDPTLGIRDPATFVCELRVSARFFGDLFAAVTAGRLPEVTLELGYAGMEFGMAPDGSQITWDVEAYAELTVQKASFYVALAAAERSNGEL